MILKIFPTAQKMEVLAYPYYHIWFYPTQRTNT